jgi:hypothetical protein
MSETPGKNGVSTLSSPEVHIYICMKFAKILRILMTENMLESDLELFLVYESC